MCIRDSRKVTGGVRLTLDRAQVALLAAVDAHGLNVDTGNGDQVGALLLIEVVQVCLLYTSGFGLQHLSARPAAAVSRPLPAGGAGTSHRHRR